MRWIILLGFASTILQIRAAKENPHVTSSQKEVYTASWAVKVTEGGQKMADVIAHQHGFINLGNVADLEDIYHFQLTGDEKSSIRTNSPYTSKSRSLLSEPFVGFAEQQRFKHRVQKFFTVPVDPLYPSQWNLLNTGQFGNTFEGNDLNVERAWLQGLTGCNITVTVVDDGLEYSHRDLWDNYVPQTSYNFVENHSDPSTNFPGHGTSCGGIIGSSKNDICGIGIAHETNLGSVALLGANDDINEASSLSYENDIVDIYSNSWGPADTGTIVDGPGHLTQMALKNGAREGREGKGSIYVWANGNGGNFDDCAADGYTQSIYTVSVGAIGVDGSPSPFDEKCSAKLVTAYVTDLNGFSAVSTTAIGGGCTTTFGGTSAATPMVSGIIALALEANPNLTWRDVQYLIVYTSNPLHTDLIESSTNGAGLLVSRQFGFGVVDAEAMVTRARHWINVPPQLEEHITPTVLSGQASFTIEFRTVIEYSGSLQFLEHVIVNMSLTVAGFSGERGDIKIELTSPSETVSTLLGHRDGDSSNGGYFDWSFMSVMFWGENPTGEWVLTVSTRSSQTVIDINDVDFIFYGVSSTPESVANIPNICHPDCRRGCAQEGSEFCDACVNLRNAHTFECLGTCPPGYTEYNGYCYNPNVRGVECNSPLKHKEGGSCADAGFSGCCVDDNCEITAAAVPLSCYCDVLCYEFNDCCDDIELIECHPHNSTENGIVTVMPYLTLGVTAGVTTQFVPSRDDGFSLPINIEFPLGSRFETTVYVGTNGYFTFQEFSDFSAFIFNGNRNLSLVAPFFTDIDISNGIGQIKYEVHTDASSQSILSQVNSLINVHAQTNFNAKWMLVAMWEDVPPYGDNTITNTFQGIIVTDFTRSFSVFTYFCGDLSYSNGATIGFTTADGFFANHPASLRSSSQSIGCLNSPASPWVNVVYEITKSVCAVDNGGCDHTCTDTVQSFECGCKLGYSLESDGRTCIDINECALPSENDCQQSCVNIIGSYMCECRNDYLLNGDGKTCSPKCGGYLTESTGSLYTPEWPHHYPSLDFRCVWVIDIENVTDAAIEIVFNEPYGIRGRDPCPTDYVEVLDGIELDSASLGRHCSKNAPDPITTTLHQATIIFQASSLHHSANRVGASMSYAVIDIANECEINNGGCAHSCEDTLHSYLCYCNEGYKLKEDGLNCIDIDECSIGDNGCEQKCLNVDGSFSCECEDGFALDSNGKTCSISCGGELSDASGSFQTPGWPDGYPQEDFICEWVINVSNPHTIRFEVDSSVYGINGRPPCPEDHIEFFDGVKSNSQSLGRFCKREVPEPITVSTGVARVVFEGRLNPRRPAGRKGVRVAYEII